MAGKKQFPNGTWQYTFKKAGVLEKPIYLTFDTEKEGDAFAARLEALLAKGIVPVEFQKQDRVLSIAELVREYERDAHPSSKDMAALRTILRKRGAVLLDKINARADRHRGGAVARWCLAGAACLPAAPRAQCRAVAG
jgi:hypothetical protein